MRGFLLRLLITALGLWVADQLLPGIAFASTGALIVSALVLGFGAGRGEPARRTATAALLAGLAAFLVDVYLY